MTRRKHKHEGEPSRPEVEGEEGLPPTDDELAAGELFTAPPASSSEATAPPSEPSTRPADELDAELQRVKAEAANPQGDVIWSIGGEQPEEFSRFEAIEGKTVKVPIIARIKGVNEEEGREMLKSAGLIPASGLSEAAEKASQESLR